MSWPLTTSYLSTTCSRGPYSLHQHHYYFHHPLFVLSTTQHVSEPFNKPTCKYPYTAPCDYMSVCCALPTTIHSPTPPPFKCFQDAIRPTRRKCGWITMRFVTADRNRRLNMTWWGEFLQSLSTTEGSITTDLGRSRDPTHPRGRTTRTHPRFAVAFKQACVSLLPLLRSIPL